MAELVSAPTPEQRAAFARLSVEERFRWLTDLLALCHELTPPAVRERWRERRRSR
jgi:hypothetical protein